MSLLDFQIQFSSINGGGNAIIDRMPNECCRCQQKVTPALLRSEMIIRDKKYFKLQVVFLCPNHDCQEIFIGLYEPNGQLHNRDYFIHKNCIPAAPPMVNFEKSISDISPSFVKIFRQAAAAEKMDLDEIAGPGYRKALEFLIKDYIVAGNQAIESEVKKTDLGTCIKTWIEHPTLKKIAERAAWLGNDETHYTRKWIDEDLQSLKEAIDLTYHWAMMMKDSESLLKRMPDKQQADKTERTASDV